ncbi:MAG TPA: MFS transporter [Stellaceae bacterium]|jgi:MFS family permease
MTVETTPPHDNRSVAKVAAEAPATGSTAQSDLARLLPLVLITFLGYLTVGMPLPVLPIYVHETLGFGTVTVGWIVGIQSIATVLTRQYAGATCDARGSKVSVLLGLPAAALAGLAYLVSALAPLAPGSSLIVLLAGRLLLGVAESLFLTGTMTWGIARIGARNAGKVMSWQGIAIYAALSAGAPMGLAIQQRWGFTGVAIVTMALPLAAMVIALPLPPVPPTYGKRMPFYRVIGRIWRPGGALALGTVSFGAMAAFIALDYAAQGWSGAGLAIAAFGIAYILVRLFLAGLPDRIGSIGVAAVSLAIVAVGQVLLWLAGTPLAALVGATVTGLGYSLIFPSMGVEAMRRVPPENRGLAVGAFVAFFDVSLALAGPITGAVAGSLGYPSAFLTGAVAAGLAVLLVLSMRGTAARAS